MHKCKYHKPQKQKFASPMLEKPEIEPTYHFILLNGDSPVGCIKGFANTNEAIIYICGMKNTFHIEPFISREEMKEFLELAFSPFFKITYFGASINIPGIKDGRQLFGVVQNVAVNQLINSSIRQEYDAMEEEIEDDILDIYPDKYEEDNTEMDPELSNTPELLEEEDEQEDRDSEDDIGADESLSGSIGSEDDDSDGEDEETVDSDKDYHCPHNRKDPCIYEGTVNVTLEDMEYGVLLDIDLTGFVDAMKPPSHHHHKKPEFDENPEDDMIQDEDDDDGIDHVIRNKYM